jgi:hypothetical protein
MFKENNFMTENEIKLIEMVRNHNDPEKALITAVEIILRYLEQPESFEEPSSACLQGFCGED